MSARHLIGSSYCDSLPVAKYSCHFLSLGSDSGNNEFEVTKELFLGSFVTVIGVTTLSFLVIMDVVIPPWPLLAVTMFRPSVISSVYSRFLW